MALATVRERADKTNKVIYSSTATGAGAMAESFSVLQPSVLKQVAVKVSATPADILTVTINSVTGAAYDVIVKTQDMSSIADSFVWVPDPGIMLRKDDSVDLAWDNSTSKTWGLTLTVMDA
jgi:hypothetical protein